MRGKPQVYALVKLANGQVVKQPVTFRGMEKIERNIVNDAKKKIWINQTHYKYIDDKNRAESGEQSIS